MEGDHVDPVSPRSDDHDAGGPPLVQRQLKAPAAHRSTTILSVGRLPGWRDAPHDSGMLPSGRPVARITASADSVRPPLSDNTGEAPGTKPTTSAVSMPRPAAQSCSRGGTGRRPGGANPSSVADGAPPTSGEVVGVVGPDGHPQAGTFSRWLRVGGAVAAPVASRASMRVICASGCFGGDAASTPAAPPPTMATRIIPEGYIAVGGPWDPHPPDFIG